MGRLGLQLWRISFMDRVFSCIAGALLLIHTVCGCCWHQAHENSACQQRRSLKSGETRGGCHVRHRRAPNRGDEPSDGPCRCRYECQGECTYLPPQITKVVSPRLTLPFDLPAAVAALAGVRLAPVWQGE